MHSQIRKNTSMREQDKASGSFLQKCKVLLFSTSGWRKTMEDADIHEVDIGDGNALFAVFDGHGGNHSLILSGFEVSEYVKRIFIKELTQNKSYT